MTGFDRLNYGTVLTPLLLLTFSLLLHSFLTVNDRGLGNVFSLDSKSTADFNFAATGDWGCTPDTKNTVRNIVDKNPELVLGLGDFAYRNNATCWFSLTAPIHDKMKITIGNHDLLAYTSRTEHHPSPERLQEYMSKFNLSSQYYSFNFQNVHFLSMSTEIPYEKGSEQYDFVKRDLQKATSEPGIDWIVVFYHRVAYTSPVYLENDYLREKPSLRKTYHPLFEKYGVDLVIQAHSHNYQRTYPIKFNSNDPSQPFIVDRNTTNYYHPEGQIYTIVGTAGRPDIHNFAGPAAPYTAAQFIAYGFLNIDVLHNGTLLEGKFFDNNGTTSDHFTIDKSIAKNKQGDTSSTSPPPPSDPRLASRYDDKFQIVPVFRGMKFPTDMAFLGVDDFLVLEKNNGTVQRIINGTLLTKPLLDVNVANKIERGLLGVAVSDASNDTNGTEYVYLYYTEGKHDGDDKCPDLHKCRKGTEPIGNRLYRYELTKDGTKLISPKLILDVPATPGPGHNGGKMILDSKSNIFIIIGDVMADRNKAQNFKDGEEPDGTGGILKIATDGNSSDVGAMGHKYPLNLYYAYGIRNGFGLDFDPVTGNLWDTENGPTFGDEINLVRPGFNSGWKDVQGVWNHDSGMIQNGTLDLGGLVDFDGEGKYSEPEFTWKDVVGPTGIKFFNSDKMGSEFHNSVFVGDIHNGNIYHFDLSNDRTSLLLNGTLADRIANSSAEVEQNIFAKGLGGITDLEVGPDGYLYIVSFGKGAIYKIAPK